MKMTIKNIVCSKIKFFPEYEEKMSQKLRSNLVFSDVIFSPKIKCKETFSVTHKLLNHKVHKSRKKCLPASCRLVLVECKQIPQSPFDLVVFHFRQIFRLLTIFVGA